MDVERTDARDKLRAYAQLYTDVFRDDRMCLCGMLAADYTTLPIRCASGSSGSSTTTRSGSLASSRRAGRRERSGSPGRPAPVARTLIGGLEGAMLVARPYRDLKRFRDAAELLIAGLAAES